MAGERGGSSRLTRAVVAVLALLAVIGIGPPGSIGVQPAAAATGSSSCTEMDGTTRVTWRVDWTHQVDYGGIIKVDGLKRIVGGTVTDAGSQTWQLRWDNSPNQWAPATAPASVVPFQQLQGPLSTIGNQWRSIFLSPRLVTPDGLCTIYLTPFANILGGTTGSRVAVLGDDLVTQLNDSTYNGQSRYQGYVEGDLNGRAIRAEVEGQGPPFAGTAVLGRRWTPASGTTGLAKADSYLIDEFRGLLEHDIDGFVMGLGINDALWIAQGAGQAARNARRDTVYNDLASIAAEIAGRGGCVAVVTSPENSSSLDPDYAWAAGQVNNFWRYVIALGGQASSAVLVDFGLQAQGKPWFGSDGVHLNAAGITAYRDTLTRAAERCSDSVLLWGKAGTLDDGLWNGRTITASGQAINARAVPGWGFDPGTLPHFSTMAPDGTMFFMNSPSAGNVYVASGSGMTAASAFNPNTNTFQNIHVKTDRGVEHPVNPTGDPVAADIGDVGVLNGGQSVAFTGRQLYLGQSIDGCVAGKPCNQPQVQGQYAMFGVMTKTGPGGTWEVKEGPDGPDADTLPDWRNAWSPRELYAATVAADPQNGAAIFDGLCPVSNEDPNGNPVRSCSYIDELAVLPDSGDVVVAHYGPRKLSVIDVGTPDANGRITASVKAWYPLPPVADGLGGTAREVQPDPSSQLGDERFGLSQDFAPGFIEFRYDANEPDPDLRVAPVSAPVLSGQLTNNNYGDPPLKNFVGYGQFHYDQNGNLWLPTSEGFNDGLGVKVYVNGPSGRKITQPECLEFVGGQPKPIQDYRATAPGARTEWGKVCQPDYNIRAQKIIGATWGVDEDPTTGNIVVTNWPHGQSMVIDPDDPTPGGTPLDMTFRVSNPVGLSALGTIQNQTVEGPCLADPAQRCTQPARLTGAIQGQVDPSGRLWVVSSQSSPGQPWDSPEDPAPPGTIDSDHPEMMQRSFDQWVYSIDLGRLLGREPQRLTAQSGQSTIVQGEVNETFGTTTVNPGAIALRDIDMVAGIGACWASSCTDGATLTSGGFAVGNEVDGGLPAGTVVEYKVMVPKDGQYQLVYRASNRRAQAGLSGNAQIRVSVDGGTPVDRTISSASMAETTSSPITLNLAPGAHTIRLSAPTNAQGWQLDWMRFSRV